MGKAFESIKRGLKQAVRHQKGGRHAALPLELYTDARIREFDREEAGLKKFLARKRKSVRTDKRR